MHFAADNIGGMNQIISIRGILGIRINSGTENKIVFEILI